MEIFHGQQGDFANSACRGKLAQAQTLEGAVMFTMDRQQDAAYNRLDVDSPTVEHYRPWLRLRANALAQRAGMPLPHPHEVEPPPDNGEKFLYDYYLAQREREKHADYSDPDLVRCPCESCVARRLTCECGSCSASRGFAGSANPTGVLGAAAADPEGGAQRLEAAAAAFERDGSDEHGPQKARQARQLATCIRGGNAQLALQLARRDGCKVDLAAIALGSAAPAAASAAGSTPPRPPPVYGTRSTRSSAKRKQCARSLDSQPENMQLTLTVTDDEPSLFPQAEAPPPPIPAAPSHNRRKRNRAAKQCPLVCDCGAQRRAEQRQATAQQAVSDSRDAASVRVKHDTLCIVTRWCRYEL